MEEIRRTIVVMGVGQSSSAQDVMDYFATGAGEVKYFRQDVNINDAGPICVINVNFIIIDWDCIMY